MPSPTSRGVQPVTGLGKRAGDGMKTGENAMKNMGNTMNMVFYSEFSH